MSLRRSLILWRSGRALLRRETTENAFHYFRAPTTLTTSNCVYIKYPMRFYSEQTTTTDSDKVDQDSSSESSSSSSESESDSDSSDDEERTAALKAALKFVPELGWSEAALAEGAKVANVGEQASEELFPRGAWELVDHFEEECNRELNDIMEKLLQEEKLTGSAMIHTSLERRLRMLIPFIDNWPQAMAVKAVPDNIPAALENLALLADDVWYFAGDRSTDMNWYTKRAIVAALYTSAELFMIQDKSDDFQDTWKFLKNRMDETKLVGKAVSDAEGVMKGVMEFFNAAVTTVKNMSGNNPTDDRK